MTKEELKDYVSDTKISVAANTSKVLDSVRTLFKTTLANVNIYHPFMFIRRDTDNSVSITSTNNQAEYLCSDLREIQYETVINNA